MFEMNHLLKSFFCIQELGLLATGSADGSIVFWKWEKDQLNSDQRIKSLSEFSHWVVKMILRSSSEHSITSLNTSNLLFSMTRDNITLHSWKTESSIQKVKRWHCKTTI